MGAETLCGGGRLTLLPGWSRGWSRQRGMDTRTVLRMAGLVAVLVCLILLVVGVDFENGIATPLDCGSVLASEKGWNGERISGCSGPLDGRLTLSLVVGAVGVAAFFGASQIKKREDD